MLQNEKKKTKRTKYNTVAIKEAADAIMVAQSIGMSIQETRGYKNRISVLCPGHDDKNHGSCFITEKGCHCYSGECNRTYDVFDMVRLHCNVDFREAAGIIADLCGGRERFLIEDDSGFDNSESNSQDNLKMISRSDMELIGIYNTPIYVTKEVIPACCEWGREFEPGTRRSWYPGKSDDGSDDYVVIEELAVKSPLLDLLRSSPQAYAELIQNKAWEMLETYRGIQSIFLKHSRECARAITPTIRKIENIVIEYGGSLRNPPEFITEGQNDEKNEETDVDQRQLPEVYTEKQAC